MKICAPYNENKSTLSGWKEHVAMYRAEVMNWYALWLSCGCPSEGYVFNNEESNSIHIS